MPMLNSWRIWLRLSAAVKKNPRQNKTPSIFRKEGVFDLLKLKNQEATISLSFFKALILTAL
jgi:hypothetical protein